jgi:N6-L-threonylcarbamoyladenine synthase
VASFQEAVVDTLVGKTLRAAREHGLSTVVVLRRRRRQHPSARRWPTKAGIRVRVLFPARALCTDNAAMIAGAAWHLAGRRRFAGLDLRPSAKMKEGVLACPA